MSHEEAEARAFRTVEQSRRAFLKKLILGSAFAVPAVASFSLSGLGVEHAQAGTSNQTFYPGPGIPGEPNCILQTVVYIQHPSAYSLPYEEFLYFVRSMEEYLHLPYETGVYAIATQWCRYGINAPV